MWETENNRTGERQRSRLTRKNITVFVSNGHLDYPGAWIVLCNEVGMDVRPLPIGSDATVYEAQDAAIKIVRHKLHTMIAEIS